MPERVGPPRDLTFQPSDWSVLSRSWFPVARADELGETPIQATLLDMDLVVYRATGTAIVETQKPEDLPVEGGLIPP